MSGTWASSWALNDVVSVAEFAKGVGCVADSTLGASAASIDLTSLPTTYSHLRIVIYARTDVAATNDGLLLRFNGDTAANYDWQKISATATAASGVESFAATSIQAGVISGSTAPANAFSVCEIVVPHYANASNHKSMFASWFLKGGTTTGTNASGVNGGAWRSTATINRVTILPGTGPNLVSGTRVTVYVGGA